jgi:microcystin-dependent protein
MSEPFLAELRLMSFVFAPKGWAQCNGQLLPINQNQPLFALLGTAFGGDGRTTFALPDLRGRVPIHFHGSHTLGEKGGSETVALTQQEMPAHTHAVNSSQTDGNVNTPGGNVLARSVIGPPYRSPPASLGMNAANVSSVGGSQAHENRQPYLVLNYCIALQGIFPSQN